jgi:hypothetical protein
LGGVLSEIGFHRLLDHNLFDLAIFFFRGFSAF